MLQVQLQLGTAVSGVGGSTVNCCHLFAGARQGSTTMLVVDIGFLRDVSGILYDILMCWVYINGLNTHYRYIKSVVLSP